MNIRLGFFIQLFIISLLQQSHIGRYHPERFLQIMRSCISKLLQLFIGSIELGIFCSQCFFSSDLIVWSGSFNRYGFELKTAYAILKQDEAAIKAYLNGRGIPDSNIVFSSVNISKNYQRRFDDKGNEISVEFSGYTLTGKVRVESKDIVKVEKLSREITELLEKGIELNSNVPEYYYTRLNEIKIDLLAKASEDAKTRAETIAKNSGGSLGGIKKATMGVFQITGKNANEDYSYGGAFNTSSKEKTASIT